jgi:FMN reductase
MADVLGIVGSVSHSSNTRTAVEVCLDAAESEFGVSTDLLHLADYDVGTADGRPLAEYSGETAEALELIVESDAYVVGTPVYRATYSGALKNLFDMVPRGRWMADVAPLEDSAVGLVATGATDHHYLSVDTALRPLMGFFGAHVSGTAYLSDDHLGDGPTVEDDAVRTRLQALGASTVELAEALEESEYLGALGPQI